MNKQTSNRSHTADNLAQKGGGGRGGKGVDSCKLGCACDRTAQGAEGHERGNVGAHAAVQADGSRAQGARGHSHRPAVNSYRRLLSDAAVKRNEERSCGCHRPRSRTVSCRRHAPASGRAPSAQHAGQHCVILGGGSGRRKQAAHQVVCADSRRRLLIGAAHASPCNEPSKSAVGRARACRARALWRASSLQAAARRAAHRRWSGGS